MQEQLKIKTVSTSFISTQYLPMEAMNRKTLDIEPSTNNARLLFFAELFASFLDKRVFRPTFCYQVGRERHLDSIKLKF